MHSTNRNKAIRAKVWERESDWFPLTVTLELGSEIRTVVPDLDDLERIRVEFGLTGRDVVFQGQSWKQLYY